MRIDVCYLMFCIASFPLFPIQFLALNDQRVDLSLQGLSFPGQLTGILDMVLSDELKLPLVAVQLRDFLPHRKWDRHTLSIRLANAQQIQVTHIQRHEAFQLFAWVGRAGADDGISLRRGQNWLLDLTAPDGR